MSVAIESRIPRLQALQTADTNGVSCPANWQPGDDLIEPAPATQADAVKRVEDKTGLKGE